MYVYNWVLEAKKVVFTLVCCWDSRGCVLAGLLNNRWTDLNETWWEAKEEPCHFVVDQDKGVVQGMLNSEVC